MTKILDNLKTQLATTKGIKETAYIDSVPENVALLYNFNGVKFYATDLPNKVELSSKYKIDGSNIVFKISLSNNDAFILDAVVKLKMKTSTGFLIKGNMGKPGTYTFTIPSDIRTQLEGEAQRKALARFVLSINKLAKMVLTKMNTMVKTAKYENGNPVYDATALLAAAEKCAKRGIDPIKALKEV